MQTITKRLTYLYSSCDKTVGLRDCFELRRTPEDKLRYCLSPTDSCIARLNAVGSRRAGDCPIGASDQNVILGIVGDFLHKPYNSVEDPLDLWFHQLIPGSIILPFTIGHSVGFGKAMAAMLIVDAVVEMSNANKFDVPELTVSGDAHQSLHWDPSTHR